MFRTAGSNLIRSLAVTAAAVALSVSLAGCSSSNNTDSDAGTPGMCTTTAQVEAVLGPNCASSCHTGATYANLDLTAASLPGLLGKAPPGGGSIPSMCADMGKMYLIPHTNPAQGLLIDKLGNNPGCGARMPYLANTPLPQTDIDCIKSWALTLTSP